MLSSKPSSQPTSTSSHAKQYQGIPRVNTANNYFVLMKVGSGNDCSSNTSSGRSSTTSRTSCQDWA
jgi:hypothetical protein